jgi:hypothetical protein
MPALRAETAAIIARATDRSWSAIRHGGIDEVGGISTLIHQR